MTTTAPQSVKPRAARLAWKNMGYGRWRAQLGGFSGIVEPDGQAKNGSNHVCARVLKPDGGIYAVDKIIGTNAAKRWIALVIERGIRGRPAAARADDAAVVRFEVSQFVDTGTPEQVQAFLERRVSEQTRRLKVKNVEVIKQFKTHVHNRYAWVWECEGEPA